MRLRFDSQEDSEGSPSDDIDQTLIDQTIISQTLIDEALVDNILERMGFGRGPRDAQIRLARMTLLAEEERQRRLIGVFLHQELPTFSWEMHAIPMPRLYEAQIIELKVEFCFKRRQTNPFADDFEG